MGSARLCCLCLSTPLSLFFHHFFFGIAILVSSLCFTLLSFNTLSLCLNSPPPLHFLPHAVLLADSPLYFPLFVSYFIVSACDFDSLYICFLNTSLNLTSFPSLSPSTPLLPLASQCSCRRTRPTQCCAGCAGPTSCWRKWSRVAFRGSAARRSAPTRRPARLLRTTRRR